jgi:hypothetical protein
MTTDGIIRMAREAGFAEGLSDTLRGEVLVWDAETKHLERFFRLAYEAGAAAERKACAKVFAAAIRARGHAQVADRLARHGIPMPGDDNGRDPV